MKKYSRIILICLVFIMAGNSCESFLDVVPPNNLTEAQYYKTEQHAIETINSCYDPLKHPGGFNINFFFLFETFSDRAIHEQPTYNNFAFSTSDSYVQNIFTYLYKGIYRCNVALEKISGMEIDEDLKDRLIGEARFLRALYNFYATTVYNEPPLIRESIKDLDVKLTNGSRQDFYNFMVEDFEAAAELLPEKYDAANLGRATKGAAWAMLGRTAVYFEQWSKAKEALLKVRQLADNGVYGLMTAQENTPKDYITAFQCNFSAIDLTVPGGRVYDSENNKESVFEIQFHYGGWQVWEGGWQADGSITDLYFGPDGYKNMVPTADYVSQFESTPAHPAGLEYDARRYATVYEPGDTIFYLPETGNAPAVWKMNLHTNISISQGFGWEKYFNPAHYSNNGPTNLKIMRYSDVLLLLAEADFHVNGEASTQLALDCINEVRERAGVPAISSVTRQAIIHERDVEFGWEWHRFFDLVRWSRLDDPWVDIETLIPNFVKGKNENLPIPIYEINLSGGNLKQNPGW